VDNAQNEEYNYGEEYARGLPQTWRLLTFPILLSLFDEKDKNIDEKGMHKDVESDLCRNDHLLGNYQVIFIKSLYGVPRL